MRLRSSDESAPVAAESCRQATRGGQRQRSHSFLRQGRRRIPATPCVLHVDLETHARVAVPHGRRHPTNLLALRRSPSPPHRGTGARTRRPDSRGPPAREHEMRLRRHARAPSLPRHPRGRPAPMCRLRRGPAARCPGRTPLRSSYWSPSRCRRSGPRRSPPRARRGGLRSVSSSETRASPECAASRPSWARRVAVAIRSLRPSEST